MTKIKINLSALVLLSALFCSTFTSSCSSKNKKGNKSENTADESNTNGINSYEQVVEHYLRIKDELVKTNAKNTAGHAKTLHLALNKSDFKNSEELKVELVSIRDSEDVEKQRLAFKNLSLKVYEMGLENKNSKIKLYRQYCPMAFDNTGAFWLSSEKEILNPYFGDKMLHCGYIKDEL